MTDKASKTVSSKETPLMKQYNQIKSKYPDACLLFRVGDFYETFGADAVMASKILGITLTKRGAGSSSETNLAGFPHHSVNVYLPKLVKAGLRVAICDQLEDPKLTKSIVKRGVTELITPGVSLNDEVLQSKSNNFLAALHFTKKNIGLALLDVSTGEFLTTEGSKELLEKLLQNFQPKEILVQKAYKNHFLELFGEDFNFFYLEDWVFKYDYAFEKLTQHFKTNSLKGFGIEDLTQGIIACGAIMYYLGETQHHQLEHIVGISKILEDNYLWMDKFTMSSLELYKSPHASATTLLDVLDKTLSPMGGRLLKRWLSLPLKDVSTINYRLEIVDYLYQNSALLEMVQYQLQQISDVERLLSKLATAKIAPRDFLYLKDSLNAILPIKASLIGSENISLQTLGHQINDCEALREKIHQTISLEAPVALNKGNVIASGVNQELDELRYLSQNSKQFLADIEKREIESTGISSLKIAFNNVFGYYIEVRNTHKEKVPENWIRKQTLVNAERYITEELKEYEAKILGTEEKISKIESELYAQLLAWSGQYIAQVQQNAQLVAQLDCLQCFAQLAKENNYVKPLVSNSSILNIKNGRHPVIEKQLPKDSPYIANDVYLDNIEQQIIMITGPNMSGKSAILRQTALIVIMAQMGSFVPAEFVEMGVLDKIFTRVGASDNISMGESTFMVEMNETASILNNLTDKSLVLLDEIGRGTSTYDGISIAWSIAEFLHQHPSKAKTLFATHYHELNDMQQEFGRIKNYNVSVKELKNNVLFLRKLLPGGSAHSFGIHVAKMAGMPQMVVHKAQKILKKLENAHGSKEKVDLTQNEVQLNIFEIQDPKLEQIKSDLETLDLNTLTPIEALMKLNELKKILDLK